MSSYSPGRAGFGFSRPRHCGYSYFYVPAPVVVAPSVYGEAYVEPEMTTPTEDVGIRVTLGVEATGFKSGPGFGGNFSGLITFEGDRWGVSLSGADTIVPADDGSYEIDHIGSVAAHLTFAFIAGQYGRLRAELGADAFFAPSITMVGPTGGFSGVVWFGGPVGLEGSIMVTPWPFTQVDARVGLAVGLGQWGLRAGWRVQSLNDRGQVDGIAHSDVFTGPYAGVSFVF